MGSKILFIEDDVATLNKIWGALKKSRLLEKAGISEETAPKNFEEFNRLCDGFAVATSFEDAIARINNIDGGQDYAMIFIDRNLDEYNDVKTARAKGYLEIKDDSKFNKEFFDYFRYLGDYLYFRLIDAGVPREKLCFLTAVSPEFNDPKEAFLLSPFVRHDPEIINRRAPLSIGAIDPLSESENEEDIFVDHLRKLETAAMRAKYRKILDNENVKSVFDRNNIENFIDLLTLLYSNKIPNNGITLRLMIEEVVRYIAKRPEYQNIVDEDCSVRHFLNTAHDYCRILPEFDGIKGALFADKTIQTALEKVACEYFKARSQVLFRGKPPTGWVECYSKRFLQHCTGGILSRMGNLYALRTPPSWPPKYIFSYIDNIYTVTSEISAHGRNERTVKDLTWDGWSALLQGMLQIMQWVADQPLN